MLVIEGSDNLGKTTAAKRLVEQIIPFMDHRFADLINYRHMGRPGPEFDFGMMYRSMIRPFVVQDRFHLGGRVWHGPDNLPLHRLSVIDAWIKSVGGLVVIFHAPSEEVYEDVLKRSPKHQLFPVDKLLEANREYLDLAKTYADFIVEPDLKNGAWVTDDELEKIAEEWLNRVTFAQGM